MVRHFAWALGVVFLLAPSHPAAASCSPEQDSRDRRTSQAQPPRPKFWIDPHLRKELGITDQQSKDIDAIFESSVPEIRASRKRMEQLEQVLSKTVHDNVADLATVTRQIDQVEAARTAYNKSRTLMLYRMNLVLSADQREQVRAMFDRDEAARKREDERRKNRIPQP
jgi:Spy/CpxP family protein refolding chaperone